MTLGSRIAVLIICLILGVSFIATTAVPAWEFSKGNLWIDFVALDSHLFLFFVSFAMLAMLAFYLPACAIVDIYWNHLQFGKLRILIGGIGLVLVSMLVANHILNTPNKSIWNIHPSKLYADKGEPSRCAASPEGCNRISIIHGIRNLREVSQQRLSLRPLMRKCSYDPLIETAAQSGPRRYCMVTTPYSPAPELKSDQDCCKAQGLYVKHINYLQTSTAQEQYSHLPNFLKPIVTISTAEGRDSQSLTGATHALTLPLKVFFLFAFIFVSALMTIHLRKIEQLYKHWLVRIETGVITGTFALLFFPLMSQAFIESQDALVGDIGRGNFGSIVPLLSLSFGVWTLLNLLYFYRRADKQVEILAKIGGTAAGIVALIQYQMIVDFLVRILGSGTTVMTMITVIACAVIIGFGLLGFYTTQSGKKSDEASV